MEWWVRNSSALKGHEMSKRPVRMAVRAIIVQDGRVLLVNAWRDGRHGLMCAPGGGAEAGSSLPENLAREVYEETGLQVDVGAPVLINEFHDPKSGYHQVEVFFHCALRGATQVPDGWVDTEAIVTEHRWVTETELRRVNHKPDSLAQAAFGGGGLRYDPLEEILS